MYTSLTLKLQKSHFYVLLTKNPTYELNEKTQGKLRTKFFYHKIILTLSNKDQNHQKTHMWIVLHIIINQLDFWGNKQGET